MITTQGLDFNPTLDLISEHCVHQIQTHEHRVTQYSHLMLEAVHPGVREAHWGR